MLAAVDSVFCFCFELSIPFIRPYRGQKQLVKVKINSLKVQRHLSCLDLHHKLALLWSAWEKQAWGDVEAACSSQACGPDKSTATFDVMTTIDEYFTPCLLLIYCILCGCAYF